MLGKQNLPFHQQHRPVRGKLLTAALLCLQSTTCYQDLSERHYSCPDFHLRKGCAIFTQREGRRKGQSCLKVNWSFKGLEKKILHCLLFSRSWLSEKAAGLSAHLGTSGRSYYNQNFLAPNICSQPRGYFKKITIKKRGLSQQTHEEGGYYLNWPLNWYSLQLLEDTMTVKNWEAQVAHSTW